MVKQRKRLGELVGPGKVSIAPVGAGERPLGGGSRAAAPVGQTGRQRRRGTDGTQWKQLLSGGSGSGGKAEPRLGSRVNQRDPGSFGGSGSAVLESGTCQFLSGSGRVKRQADAKQVRDSGLGRCCGGITVKGGFGIL